MKRFLVLCAIVAVLAQYAQAVIPRTIGYQGVLTDDAGVVVPNGSYSIAFRIYNTAGGGSALWQETQSVAVLSGRFNAILGTTTSLDLLPFDEKYWLGMQVESDPEMTPRIELAAASYSLNSRTVEDNAITSSKISNSTVVRSLNALQDDVLLVAGANVTITPSGNALIVSATSGSAGFPAPDYDSGWISLAPGQGITLSHGIGGDVNDYVVDLQCKDSPGSESYEIHNIGHGGDLFGDVPQYRIGNRYQELTASQIKVRRMDNDSLCDYFRVRIWVHE